MTHRKSDEAGVEHFSFRPSTLRCVERRLVAFGLLVVTSSVAGKGEAKSHHPVTSVEVDSQGNGIPKDWRKPLRASLERELKLVDWARVPSRDGVVLSTSLVKLDTLAQGRSVKVECQVSISIRKAHGGLLQAVLQGRSRTEEDVSAVATAQLDALNAAVRGAIEGLPTALAAGG